MKPAACCGVLCFYYTRFLSIVKGNFMSLRKSSERELLNLRRKGLLAISSIVPIFSIFLNFSQFPKIPRFPRFRGSSGKIYRFQQIYTRTRHTVRQPAVWQKRAFRAQQRISVWQRLHTPDAAQAQVLSPTWKTVTAQGRNFFKKFSLV